MAECLVGARVCYYEAVRGRTSLRRCDHEGQHNARWREALSANERRLEVGTVTAACSECTTKEHALCLEVKWDCGVVQHYCCGRLDSLKAYDLAPTGKHSCVCGPGSYWYKHSCVCVAQALCLCNCVGVWCLLE